jgi:hypothetical protein
MGSGDGSSGRAKKEQNHVEARWRVWRKFSALALGGNLASTSSNYPTIHLLADVLSCAQLVLIPLAASSKPSQVLEENWVTV